MTYEYECTACGHQWEAEQSIKEDALKDCQACGKATAKRLVSGGTGFRLKGEGWTPASHFGGDPLNSGAKIANTAPSAPSVPSVPRGPGSFNN